VLIIWNFRFDNIFKCLIFIGNLLVFGVFSADPSLSYKPRLTLWNLQ